MQVQGFSSSITQGPRLLCIAKGNNESFIHCHRSSFPHCQHRCYLREPASFTSANQITRAMYSLLVDHKVVLLFFKKEKEMIVLFNQPGHVVERIII